MEWLRLGIAFNGPFMRRNVRFAYTILAPNSSLNNRVFVAAAAGARRNTRKRKQMLRYVFSLALFLIKTKK
jgi:hypothetical protein